MILCPFLAIIILFFLTSQRQKLYLSLHKRRHNVQLLSNIIFLPNSLISRSSLMVSLMVFLGLPLPPGDLTPLHLTYSPSYITTGFPSTYTNYLSLVSTVFSTKHTTLTVSNVVVYNHILSSLTTYPTQYSHLYKNNNNQVLSH